MSGTNLHENQQRSWGWKCVQWGELWEGDTSTPIIYFYCLRFAEKLMRNPYRWILATLDAGVWMLQIEVAVFS